VVVPNNWRGGNHDNRGANVGDGRGEPPGELKGGKSLFKVVFLAGGPGDFEQALLPEGWLGPF
jgi:hypothetical protein